MLRSFGKELNNNVQNLSSNNKPPISGNIEIRLTTKKRKLEKHSPATKGKRSKISLNTEGQENIIINESKFSKASTSTVCTIGDIPKSIEFKVRSISLNNDDTSVETRKSPSKRDRTLSLPNRDGIRFELPETYYNGPRNLPQTVIDFDKSQINDLASEPHYAHDVFDYFREKELEVKITKYLESQTELSKPMRAVLVDWMVEVQESFELNHETLYLAVKLVDHYLSSAKKVSKNKFQLLGATSLLIAAKFDVSLVFKLDLF